MSKMLTTILASLGSVLVFMPVAGGAQRRPDLSGDWVLVRATTTRVRSTGQAGSPQATGETPTTSTTVSGAAFNCGRECTITHKGQTLTIDKALLGSDGKPVPAVTLQLDGRQIAVPDSFNPGGKIPMIAKWNGDKLEIISSTGPLTATQSLALDAAQLVVVTSFNRPSAQPVTFRYKKK